MSADFMTLIVIVILFAIALVTGAYSYRRNKRYTSTMEIGFLAGN